MGHAVRTEATARDFDFWMGRWNVRNRRLRERLAGSDEWEEFEATSVARLLLDGMGNEDEFRTDHEGGFVGMSFRFFDPEKKRWSIYWADSRRCGVLPTPVRLVRGRHRRLRGNGHVRGPAHPRAVHLVGRHHADAALGAGVLRRRRGELGDER